MSQCHDWVQPSAMPGVGSRCENGICVWGQKEGPVLLLPECCLKWEGLLECRLVCRHAGGGSDDDHLVLTCIYSSDCSRLSVSCTYRERHRERETEREREPIITPVLCNYFSTMAYLLPYIPYTYNLITLYTLYLLYY